MPLTKPSVGSTHVAPSLALPAVREQLVLCVVNATWLWMVLKWRCHAVSSRHAYVRVCEKVAVQPRDRKECETRIRRRFLKDTVESNTSPGDQLDHPLPR